MNADHFFDVHVSKDCLSASLIVKKEAELDEESLTPQHIKEWLLSKKIAFGVNQQVVETICRNPKTAKDSVEIAKGIKPENGSDSYLKNEVDIENQSDHVSENQQFNFKNIIKIPSVKSGQLLATIVPATNGLPGKDVYGNEIKAKPGKTLRLRPGKNTIVKNNKVWATTDGQISISSNSVNVFPVFEVKGDLDLNTGNIHFIGNVMIYGNVPSGYEIKAGGDVKIMGLVEAATIEAQGSIYISGGIAGQKKAVIKAGVDVHTQYINQATVVAGNDVEIENFIMHSEVAAGNRIVCKKAHIIGGKISAGQSIEANEIGNQHFARTELFIGIAADLIQRERNTIIELKNIKDSLTKLALLKERLEEKQRATGHLSATEQQMMEKQQQTATVLGQKVGELETELEELQQQIHQTDKGFLAVHDKLYPNNIVTFSKYTMVIQKPLIYVKLYLDQGEIVSVPL